jgi:hypothetical protein
LRKYATEDEGSIAFFFIHDYLIVEGFWDRIAAFNWNGRETIKVRE